MPDLLENRLALIPILAKKSANGYMGRTALMKYMYFLQTLRKVPLGYRFTLYSYGPFDSDVLADLGMAEDLGAVESNSVAYPGGYGYEIKPGRTAEWLQKRAAKFLSQYKSDIDWVTENFGRYTSPQLELISTIIYVDREAARNRERVSIETLARRVQEIKPHFRDSQVSSIAEDLRKNKLLQAIA
jgi:hypothetical protein